MIEGGASGEEVDVLTMGTILDGHNEEIDLLKVDIEGAERELFSSCGEWVQRAKVIVAECHGGYTSEQLRDDIGDEFAVVHLECDPRYGHEVVVLKNRSQGMWLSSL